MKVGSEQTIPPQPRPSGRAGWVVAAVIAVAAIGLFVAFGHNSGPKPKPDTTPAATATPAPTGTATPGTSSAETSVSVCTAGDLTANVLPASGAAGTEYYTLTLTNDSQQSCTMTGYPGVSLVNDVGAQLGPAANRDTVSPVTALTLGIGQLAYATLGLPNPGNYNPGVCSGTSISLKIYPPNQTSSLTAKFAAQACPGWTVTAVHTTQP
jgi:hypothetical protein